MKRRSGGSWFALIATMSGHLRPALGCRLIVGFRRALGRMSLMLTMAS
jgi:hypothetical protein